VLRPVPAGQIICTENAFALGADQASNRALYEILKFSAHLKAVQLLPAASNLEHHEVYRAHFANLEHFPAKPVPDLIRDGNRFAVENPTGSRS
jgi:hypothetical protein